MLYALSRKMRPDHISVDPKDKIRKINVDPKDEIRPHKR